MAEEKCFTDTCAHIWELNGVIIGPGIYCEAGSCNCAAPVSDGGIIVDQATDTASDTLQEHSGNLGK